MLLRGTIDQNNATMDAYISTRLEPKDKEGFQALAVTNQRTPSDLLRLLILKANKEQTDL